MTTSYGFDCPYCDTSYIGEIDEEGSPQHKKYTCEDCGKTFEVSAFIEVNVRTEKLP